MSGAVVAVVIGVAVAVTLVLLLRMRSSGSSPDRELASAPVTTDEDIEVLVLPTERPNEIYFFGPATELDGYGTTLATSPPQLARHAAAMLNAGVDGVRSYAGLSGRLVLVDERTAAALKSGKMMKDKAGEILAHVLDDKSKISSVTRIREVGSLAATAASLTNAISAMAMQAQLDRIERQLSAISDGIDKANRELLRQWHSTTVGIQNVLREVYRTASSVGELTPANWEQIAPNGHVVQRQITGDRDRLAEAVRELERLASAPDVKRRMKELDAKVEAVLTAHAALTESTRMWAQFSTLRLWHFTVTDEPTIEAYRRELETFIERSRDDIEPLRLRAESALRQVAKFRWSAQVLHPFIVRRLPTVYSGGLKALGNVNWRPLELQPSSNEIELTGEDEVDREP